MGVLGGGQGELPSSKMDSEFTLGWVGRWNTFDGTFDRVEAHGLTSLIVVKETVRECGILVAYSVFARKCIV